MYEMYTGDITKRPARLWRAFNTHQSLNIHGWPFIDHQIFNLLKLSLSYHHWPIYQDLFPYFTQIPGLQYHFGSHVATRRKQQLAIFIIPHRSVNVYSNSLKAVNRIITVMHYEVQQFFLNGFGILQQRHMRECEMRSTSQPLAMAISLWESSSKPLSFQYIL